MKYNVQWTKQVLIITAIVFVVIPIIGYVIVTNPSLFIKVILSIALLSLLAFFINAPRYISVDEKSLTLHKMIGKIKFPLDSIIEIGTFIPDKSNIRVFGSGGFGGFIGIFKNKSFGYYRAYLGDFKQSFYLKTYKNRYYVLSCTNKEDLFMNLKKYLK